MSCKSALVVTLLLGNLIAAGDSMAQLVPPAGSAGAGPSAVNGIPAGPANPSVLSDPAGIGNASRMPPVATHPPPPPPPASYGAASPSPTRAATPYAGVGASQRIIVPRQANARRAPFRPHGRGRAEVSSFTGICRGC
jgi:hypothetical protein